MLDEEKEENIQVSDIRAAQTIVGELLWASCRTRPDLSFAVAWLGRNVSKCPCRVLTYSRHTLGYLLNTPELCLKYGKCEGGFGEDNSLAFPRSMRTLEVYSDAALGSNCQRGHQGLIALYGGSPVQWDSRLQPFAVLSTTESELVGYCDGMVLGESVSTIVEILEENQVALSGDKVLYGDSLSGLKLLESPDGPWRTRHLRLRSHVLRERMQWGLWKGRHVPGSELAADLLTKSISAATLWEKFYKFMGLVDGVSEKEEHLEGSGGALVASKKKVAALTAVVALGTVLKCCHLSDMERLATTLGITALVAWVAHQMNSERNAVKAQAIEKGCLRETELRPIQVDAKVDEPALAALDIAANGCTEGSSAIPRLSALRADLTYGPRPWEAPEFNQPPHAANDDLWITMGGGWVVRIHRSLRSRLFHPVHRSCPVRTEDLEAQRVSVIWWSGDHGWEKSVQHDNWYLGQVPPQPPVSGQWRGWTFFRLRESSQGGGSSSQQPRIQPDTLVWTPEESGRNMPRQFGVSSSSRRRTFVESGEGGHSRGPGNPVRWGHPTAAERGAAAKASINTIASRYGHAGSTVSASASSDGSCMVCGWNSWWRPWPELGAEASDNFEPWRFVFSAELYGIRGCFMESRRAIVRVQASARWKG